METYRIFIYSTIDLSVLMASQLVNVAESIFDPKKYPMPLNSRENILTSGSKAHQKARSKKSPSPGFQGNRLEDDRIQSRMTDQFNLMSPRSREGNSKKKSLFCSQANKGLFKEARKVDIHDPRQTFLPSSKVKSKSPISKDTKRDYRKFSAQNNELHHLNLDRNVLNMYVRKESQGSLGSKDHLSLSELHFSDETKEEETSLTKLIFFGGQESIEYQALHLEKQVSTGEEVQCRKLLRQLSGDQTNESSEGIE